MEENIIIFTRKFIEARQKAEREGKKEFTCPICGGKAAWDRSPYNNHLRCWCKGCGFRMME